MPRTSRIRGRLARRIGTVIGIGGLLALSMGTGTLSTQAAPAKLPTTTTLISSSSTLVTGAPVTLTATVATSGATTPTGSVQFTAGLVTLGSSALVAGISAGTATAQLTTSFSTAGIFSLAAGYLGDANVLGSVAAPLLQTVTAILRFPTTTSLSSTPNPSTAGQAVTLTATVSGGLLGTPSGTVDFKDGSTTLGSAALGHAGTATLSVSTLAASSTPHSLTAVYSGDLLFYSGSTSPPVSQVVNKAPSSVALTASPSSATAGAAVILTATVTPSAATGTVTFKDGTTTLGTGTLSGGTATFTTSSLAVGPHSITAAYGGDGTYAVSSSSPATTVTVTAVVPPSTTTATAVTSNHNPSASGQAVTLTATVTPGSSPTPTGTITFEDGTTAIGGAVTLTGATATTTTSSLTAGPHSITAVYSGDSHYTPSTSPALSQVVTAPPPADTVTVVLHSHALRANGAAHTGVTATVTAGSPAAAVPGVIVTWTASPAGSVTFGTPTSTTDVNGIATNTVTAGLDASPTGTKTTVTATEPNGSGSDQERLLAAQFSQPLTFTPSSVTVNGQSTATTIVVDGNGHPVAGEPVDFTSNGGGLAFANPDAITDSTGTATSAVMAGSTPGSASGTATDSASDSGVPADTLASTGTLAQTAAVTSPTTTSFVNAAYTTMLGHGPDPGGLAYWVNRIDGGSPRSDLAWALANTPEYRTDVISGNGVNDFYNLYLDRTGEAGGIQYWVNRMAGIGGDKLTFEQVRLRFAGSPEYFASPAVGNNDKLTAIRALYTDLLGRTDGGDSDTLGQAYWMGHYDATRIAAQFLFSPEGRSVLVNTLYQQILKRNAEAQGLAYWTGLLLSGASDENIIASILGSDEYFNTH